MRTMRKLITKHFKKDLKGTVLMLLLAAAMTSCFGGGVYHTVRKGETLWRISRTYDVKLSRIARANHIRDPRDIDTGVRLYIPGATRVKRVPRVQVSKVSHKSAKREVKKIKKYRGGFLWPLRGKLLHTFGSKNGIRNDGIDIQARGSSTAVKAAKDGEVVYVGSSYRAYGSIVIIRHSDDIYTVYANNRSNSVRRGERVKRGEIIARVGSGAGNENFIHFEVREGKRPVNPLFFLP